ncbi:MAG: DNA polymerase III subunit alpha [Saprospiraceae bacterium]|nr:DNA polymerase III subunit alpha [Saprospiraceae bacterium]
MHLNCHTYYSLRYGTLSPEQLVLAAKRLGITSLALTDINNTSAAGEFVRLCQREGIKSLLGIDFRNADGQRLYLGIARNAEGFHDLCKYLSDHSLNGKPLPETVGSWQLAVGSSPSAIFIYPKLIKPIDQFKPHEYLGIRPEHVHLLYSSAVKNHPEKLLIMAPATFLDDEGYELHRMLRAIDQNTLITKLEPKDCAKKNELLHPPDVLETLYAAYPTIIENTKKLVTECEISFETGLQVNRQTFTGNKDGDFKLLEKLALNGCQRRYGGAANCQQQKANSRVQKELKVIREMDFPAYFLITWDIVRYAQSVGYHHVGRGSGANSIVAYCLGITDVEPLELDLYFERFINPQRSSPPDFDIDFSWDERDDVTDYIFKRYGREHVALLATYSTFQFNAAVRELGKVFGLPKEEIDRFADSVLKGTDTEDIRTPQVGFERIQLPSSGQAFEGHPITSPSKSNSSNTSNKSNNTYQEILKYARLLHDFPNHLSIHAGGVIISERPIFYHTALQMMPKGFPVSHFDMYHAEEFGFHKFDVLSQRGLGHIKDAVALVKKNQGRAVDVHDLDAIKQDERVRAQLRSGNCMGCFYIESPAMRGLLHKLRCDDYVHLVAASSIIRPGVAKSGMMREYIKRFHSPHSFEYLHPVFKEHLGETYGVMVFQEDVMKIVHHFAGLGLDESDVLRRMMTGKKRDKAKFERLREKYFVNCKERGYPDALAQEVWRQIESFAGYSFCKAHSASFAAESFQSLYLKSHFPLEFMVAVINNFGGFYHTEYYFHEARMAGANIHAPCVNHSLYLTNIEGTEVYIGFIHLGQMERTASSKIVAERTRNGPFRSLADFTNRIDIGSSQLDILIRIGAFRFTGLSKCQLMWEKNAVFNPKLQHEASGFLFDDDEFAFGNDKFVLPELTEGRFDQAFDEIELLGFPLCSPFDLLEKNEPYTGTHAAELKSLVGRMVVMEGYYVCRKDVRTVKGELMYFGTWLDREGRFFDTTHFPNFVKLSPFRGKGIYRIEGRVAEEYGFPSIEVVKMERLAWQADERYGD